MNMIQILNNNAKEKIEKKCVEKRLCLESC